MRGRKGVGAALGTVAVAGAFLLLLASCSGGAKNAGSTTRASSTAAAHATATFTDGRNAGFQAYTACLQQHGVTLAPFDQGARSNRPRPTGSFARPSGLNPRRSGDFSRSPGGGFLGTASADPSLQAALQACANERPQRRFGASERPTASRSSASISTTTFASFKDCMSSNGVTIAATNPQAALQSLDRTDPKTAAALKICEPILKSSAG
jgi:hypothetical protein